MNISDVTMNFTHSRSRALAVQLAINVLNRVIKCVNCLSLVMKCLHNYWCLAKCAPYALCYINLAITNNVIDIPWSLIEVKRRTQYESSCSLLYLINCMFFNYMHFVFYLEIECCLLLLMNILFLPDIECRCIVSLRWDICMGMR